MNNKLITAVKKWGARDVKLVVRHNRDYMRHENTYNLYSVLSDKARLVPYKKWSDIGDYLGLTIQKPRSQRSILKDLEYITAYEAK